MEILLRKRLLTVAILCLSFPVLYSANYQLQNSNFESWGKDPFKGEPQPDVWNLSNVSQAGYKFPIGKRTSDAHSGSYAVELQSKEVGAAGFYDVAPSWITLGTPWATYDTWTDPINTGSGGTDGGMSWTARPDTMAVWVKRIAPAGETMSLLYYSWKGTAHNSKYKAKDGSCIDTSHTDEESDICRTSDGNTCSTPSGNAVQVAEGWLKSTQDYPEWSLIKVPIKYLSNDRPEKMNVIMCVGNYPNKRASTTFSKTSKLLVDDISLIYSSKIHELRFDGFAYSRFNKDKLDYYYMVEGDKLPVITCYRSERLLSGDEISIKYTPKDQGPTTITVKAEDGSSTTTYNVYFVSQMDSDPYVKSIKVDGMEVPGFNPYITEYDMELPYGTSKPKIEVEKASEKQSYEISMFKVPGTVQIHTYAENKEYSATYVINFKVKEFDDTTLKNIFINGEPIKDFAPTKTIYRVKLPEGSAGVQKITYESAYPEDMQTITVNSRDISEVSTITVSAPGAKLVREYRIMFSVDTPDNPEDTECDNPAENRLEQIMINGEPIDDYDPDVVRYTLEYEKYGANRVVSCQRMCDESSVKVTDSPYDNSTLLMVTSKSGSLKTYTLRYVHKYAGERNRLSSIIVNGNAIEGFKPDVFNYTVDINSADSLVIGYVKGYDVQSVVVSTSGKGEAILHVISNQTGVDDVKYKLKFNRRFTINALSYIKIDGKPIDGFKPDKFKYVVNVRKAPDSITAETVAPDGRVNKTLEENNHVRFETNNMGQSAAAKYDVYLHYEDDVIPNGDFENWTKCLHNDEKDTDKPVGWVVPADKVSTKYKFDTKYLIEKGTGQVILKTVRNYWTLGGRFPGIMTIGNLDIELKVAGNSTVKVNGGIPFHNTPDAIEMKYNPVSNNKGYIGIDDNDIHMYCTIKDDDQTRTYGFKDLDFNNTWKVREVPIRDKFKNPTELNIWVNSGKYDNADDYGYYANWFDGVSYDLCSKLIVDYIRFKYNSRIARIKVNGEDAVINGTDAMAIISSESTGEPMLEIEGEVDDQMYDIKYGEYKDNVYNISIRSYAEDGTYTDYNLKVTRSKSDKVGVKSIFIDGKPLEGFDTEKHQYEYELPAGVRYVPDVAVVGDSYSQTSKVEYTENSKGQSVTVTASSESGAESVSYKIVFVQSDTDVADLKNIIVSGHELNFKPDSTKYYIKRRLREDRIPSVAAVKYAENQKVVSVIKGEESVYVINVKSASGDNEKEYRVEFSPVPSEVGTLDMIYYNGVKIDGFDPNVNEYEVTLPYGTSPDIAITYDLTPPGTQTVTPKITVLDESHVNVVLDVVSEAGVFNEYKVDFQILEDNESRLSDLRVFGKTIEGFDPDRSVYVVELEAYTDSSKIPFVKDVEYETMSPRANASVRQITRENISITSVAQNGESSKYVIKTSILMSDNTELEALYYKDAILDDFSSDVHDYVIKLPFGSSSVDKDLVTYTAKETGQSVMIVKSDSETEIAVEAQVVAQDGIHKSKYIVHFVPDNFDPTSVPTANDVCITGSVTEGWRFTTKCENVSVVLSTLGGAVERIVRLPVVDPNCEDICAPCANGYTYNEDKGGILIYSFLYSSNKLILSGKIKKN